MCTVRHSEQGIREVSQVQQAKPLLITINRYKKKEKCLL